MKNIVIADSSGIISLISETDKNHKLAVTISKRFEKTTGSIIIPSDVFSETLNIAGKKLGHKTALNIADLIEASGTFLIIDSNEKLRKQALVKFQKQPQSVSFTDCMVMAVADSLGTSAIFGFDEVFSRYEYKRLGLDD